MNLQNTPLPSSAEVDHPLAYEIVMPTGRIAKGTCDMIVAPAADGEVGIMKNHSPYMAALGTGVVRLKTGEQTEKIFVSNGFIEVLANKVIILAEVAEKGSEIDVVRAERSLERAKNRLADITLPTGHATPGGHIDRLRARRSYDRAKARLKAAGLSIS